MKTFARAYNFAKTKAVAALQFVRRNSVAVATAVGFGAMTVAGSANATLDPSVQLAVTGIVTDATSLDSMLVPAIVTIMGFFVVIKLIKRFFGKA